MTKLIYPLVIAAVATLGCKHDQVRATVDCEVKAGPTVDCTIAQTKGTADVEVCWDFKVACASGATLEAARSCARVKDGQSSTATIPTDKLEIVGACTGAMNASISNLTINGDPAQP